MKVSFVIPLYNEERCGAESLNEVWGYLSRSGLDFDLVLVNDGSGDRTGTLIEQFAAGKSRIRTISFARNQGKGEAVKQGMLAATGDFRFFFDMDLSVPLDTIAEFIAIARVGTADVIIGTRKTGSAHIVKKQPLYRELLGKGFTRLTNAVLRTDYSDITCGFKCFSSESAAKLFAMQKIKRWSFDAEILFLVRKYGYRVAEVPVTWRDDPRSKVRLLKDIIRSFAELVRIRLMYL
jgi:dolichyl-phosphate beta-glucosyltransferase